VGSIDETTPFAYYLPYAQDDGGAPYLIVRTQVASKQMEGLIQRRLAGLDDRVRAWVVEDFHGEIFGAHVSSWKLGSTLFAGFGLLATVVAMVGLYAVLAFDVEQRRREIGVRTALGAGRDAIMRMFVRRATVLTAAGSVAGILLALLLAPRIQPLLFETSARDPLTFGIIATVLVLAGIAASGVPAWRAARIDPNRVLREE
jgi:ABC-type antimicrobial peptide transport system permease subunit